MKPMNAMKKLVAVAVVLTIPLAEAAVKIEHWVAPTGARVYFVETRALPIIDVQVDFSAGAARDPAGKSGLAQLTRGLMDLGAGDLDESAIAERLADLGARLGGGADTDRASVSLRTLADTDKRGPAFDILRRVIAEPRFPEAVFERERTRTLAALRESLTRPETIASRAFWSSLYGAHPYGMQPTAESLTAIGLDDLRAFHAAHYVARSAAVTIVGALSRAEAEALALQLQRFDTAVLSIPELDLAAHGIAERFDVIVCCGNVMPFLAPSTRRDVLTRLGAHLDPGGRIAVGFGSGRDYDFAEYRDDVERAGLIIDLEFATWDLRPMAPDAEFMVSILRTEIS